MDVWFFYHSLHCCFYIFFFKFTIYMLIKNCGKIIMILLTTQSSIVHFFIFLFLLF